MAPSTMKAVKCVGTSKTEVQEVAIPKLRDDYVLVKVKAVALNPTDWKHVEYMPGAEGATVGCDLAGVIEEIGPKVTKSFKKGDRVGGFTHGCNMTEKEDGCFAEYAVVKGDLAYRIPDNLTDQQAATLGVGITTVGLSLYQKLDLPLPGHGTYGKYVMIYGGSTATGTLAIQYAKLSGADVVVTCSPRNFDLVKSLGAAEAFDYNDPDCAKKIREFTKDSLTKVFDCISEGQSPKICEESTSSKGGEICYLLRAKHTREDITLRYTLGYTVTGEPFKFFKGEEWPGIPEDFEYGKKFWALSEKLLADGKIEVHPPEVRDGGLQAISGGMKDLKEGRVSGKKLVYNIS